MASDSSVSFEGVEAVELFYRTYGVRRHPPLIILHGLFGMSDNWHSIARVLGERFFVVVPDLRNHGRSPWHSSVRLVDFAVDVKALADRLGFKTFHLMGHSLGGKIAMWLAVHGMCNRLRSLVVVDIGVRRTPVYPMHEWLFQLFEEVEGGRWGSRKEIERFLRERGLPEALVYFLLKNLRLRDGRYVWRVGWRYLRAGYEALRSGIEEGESCEVPMLVIHGEDSPLLHRAEKEEIRRYFPRMRWVTIRGAGHWVHADQPQVFLQVVLRFLGWVEREYVDL